MKPALALMAVLLLAACATKPSEPIIRTVEVRVPVPVACAPADLGSAPGYPDTDAALRGAPGAAERYLLIAAGRLLRQARLDVLEKVVEACR